MLRRCRRDAGVSPGVQRAEPFWIAVPHATTTRSLRVAADADLSCPSEWRLGVLSEIFREQIGGIAAKGRHRAEQMQVFTPNGSLSPSAPSLGWALTSRVSPTVTGLDRGRQADRRARPVSGEARGDGGLYALREEPRRDARVHLLQQDPPTSPVR